MEKEDCCYEDIIRLQHHQSATRKKMSLHDRAAQFMPFRALTGYEDCIRETARQTDRRVELNEEEQAAIGAKLYALQTALAGMPRGCIPGIRLEYFVQDAHKPGGVYVRLTGAVKRVDDIEKCITIQDGTRIPMEDISALDGAFFEHPASEPGE